jgi:hypothetical protein
VIFSRAKHVPFSQNRCEVTHVSSSTRAFFSLRDNKFFKTRGLELVKAWCVLRISCVASRQSRSMRLDDEDGCLDSVNFPGGGHFG